MRLSQIFRGHIIFTAAFNGTFAILQFLQIGNCNGKVLSGLCDIPLLFQFGMASRSMLSMFLLMIYQCFITQYRPHAHNYHAVNNDENIRIITKRFLFCGCFLLPYLVVSWMCMFCFILLAGQTKDPFWMVFFTMESILLMQELYRIFFNISDPTPNAVEMNPVTTILLQEYIAVASFDENDPQCSICLCNFKLIETPIEIAPCAQDNLDFNQIHVSNIPLIVVCLKHCGHFFHENCLHSWSSKSKTCPLCRQKYIFTETELQDYQLLQ
jgi:hypothetical protein